MQFFFRHYLLILSAMLLFLSAAILACNPSYLSSLPTSLTAAYIKNAVHGRYGSGWYTVHTNHLDFSLLQPGDILLGGNPGGGYGHFTHAGLYLGQEQILEGYVDCGNSRHALADYHQYEWACVLRVKLPAAQREKAVQYARRQEFKTFYPEAFKPGERYWNCTKLIWAAYRQVGIDLDHLNDLWIAPDSIFRSPYVRIIASEGKMSP